MGAGLKEQAVRLASAEARLKFPRGRRHPPGTLASAHYTRWLQGGANRLYHSPAARTGKGRAFGKGAGSALGRGAFCLFVFCFTGKQQM